MTLGRRVLGWVFAGFLSSAVFQACSSGAGDPSGPHGSGSAGSGGSTQSDGMVVDAPPGGGEGGESPYDPLCGVTETSCIPDAMMGDRSCAPASGGSGGTQASGGRGGAGAGGAGHAGTATNGGTAGEAGAAGHEQESGQGGMSGGAGEGGRSEGGAPAEASGAPSEGGAPPVPTDSGGESSGGQSSSGEAGARQPSSSGEAGVSAGASGKTSGSGGGAPVPRSCQVELRDGEPRAVCAPSGEGEASSACFSSGDCAPGLACVGDASPGQCRPYCCLGDSACRESGTHCTPRTLVGTDPKFTVPVCMPATGCNLADEYPCGDAGACSCPEKTACIVVTDDGKTSCVPAVSLGEGETGEPCPCAWDHVCSKATNRCVKLCQTALSGDECGGARCQFAAGLPPGWGVCLTASSPGG